MAMTEETVLTFLPPVLSFKGEGGLSPEGNVVAAARPG